MKMIKKIFILIMILIFVSGMGISLYPALQGYLVDTKLQQDAEVFLERIVLAPDSFPTPLEQDETPATTEPEQYTQLWRDMTAYNEKICRDGQTGLDCEYAYEQPSFVLADYGLENEMFAVLSIPVLELEMPIYLGATYQHMADGAVHLSQTSIPIGGENTNCVIAGHRGWGGASYFRYLDKLKPGDLVTITNLWQTLNYEVTEIRIIQPNEVDEILIRSGQELLTLLTCHPYASGGRQRYLVICKRI